MDFMSQISSVFNVTQAPGGQVQGQPSPVSSFFSNLVSGAERGAAQAASGSTLGTQLQGFLTQGQSQLAAQNLFGNPLVLLAIFGLVGFAAFHLLKR